jgi:hypothetical protein
MSARLQLEALEDRLAPAAHIGGTTFATIQAAVNAANPGAVITVDPGVYNEAVTVNKSVTLEGAQHGTAGQSASRTGNSATESVVGSGSFGFNVTASNVTIDGFTIAGANDQTTGGFGVYIATNVSGTHLVDNIIQNNIIGLGLSNTGVSQAVVQDNLFRTNNNAGPGAGTAIYSDQTVSGSLSNVLINHNTFAGNDGAGIALNSSDSSHGATNITISNNTFDDNGQQIYLYNTTSAVIADNSFAFASASGGAAALGLYGNDVNIAITDNLFLNGNAFGVRIGNFRTGPNSSISFNNNSISGFATGLRLDPGGYSGTLNATANYWGAATGPASPNNPGGTGVVLDDSGHQVVFAPWLSSGSNGVAAGQAGFAGNQGSLVSSNPTSPGDPGSSGSSPGGPATLADVQHLILTDLTLAQQFLSSGLDQAQQQFGMWFALAFQQSPTAAFNLVFDEISLTTGAITAVQDMIMGKADSGMLATLGQLEASIASNPLASTTAGQTLMTLTGPLVLAELM